MHLLSYKLQTVVNSQLGILERLLLGVRRLEEEPDTTMTVATAARARRTQRDWREKSCKKILSTKIGFRQKFMKISKSNLAVQKSQTATTCTTMTLLLTHFPHEMLQKIIVFADDDAKILWRREKTCRAFRNVVCDDRTWRHVPVLGLWPPRKLMGSEAFGTVEPMPPSYFKSHREYVCVMEAIRRCWEEQVGSSCNIFIETHDSLEQWKSLVQNKCRMLFVYDDNAVDLTDRNLCFEKDSSYTIAECTGTYPILTSDCLRHTKRFENMTF
jgi:hypothetical protein